MSSDAPIGVFDSGLGGVNVLAELIRLMPEECYIYFGDTANNPYGTKPIEDVKQLTWDGVRWLIEQDVKAIVIACNTATSALINELRSRLTIPVFGIEPAIKPALLSPEQHRILLMATPLTIAEKKFRQLLAQMPHREAIVPIPCPGLAELIEDHPGELTEEKIRELFRGMDLSNVTGVVLGCTHYPLIQHQIETVIGHTVTFYDGAEGLARHVRQVLEEQQKLSEKKRDKPEIRFFFTDAFFIKRKQAEGILQRRGIEHLVDISHEQPICKGYKS